MATHDDIEAATGTAQAIMQILATRDTSITDLLVAPLVVASMAARTRGFSEEAFVAQARAVFRGVARQTPDLLIPTA